MNAESNAILQVMICETKHEIQGGGNHPPLGSRCHKKSLVARGLNLKTLSNVIKSIAQIKAAKRCRCVMSRCVRVNVRHIVRFCNYGPYLHAAPSSRL